MNQGVTLIFFRLKPRLFSKAYAQIVLIRGSAILLFLVGWTGFIFLLISLHYITSYETRNKTN